VIGTGCSGSASSDSTAGRRWTPIRARCWASSHLAGSVDMRRWKSGSRRCSA
jgi:hypothetical protein